jgi:hypothetical protein
MKEIPKSALPISSSHGSSSAVQTSANCKLQTAKKKKSKLTIRKAMAYFIALENTTCRTVRKWISVMVNVLPMIEEENKNVIVMNGPCCIVLHFRCSGGGTAGVLEII